MRVMFFGATGIAAAVMVGIVGLLLSNLIWGVNLELRNDTGRELVVQERCRDLDQLCGYVTITPNALEPGSTMSFARVWPGKEPMAFRLVDDDGLAVGCLEITYGEDYVRMPRVEASHAGNCP